MPHIYQLLTQDEQDEIIAEYIKAQERELFCHELNLQRFEQMLPALPEGEWKQRIKQLHTETIARISEVESIMKATVKQAPPTERLQAAMERVKAKEQARLGSQPGGGVQPVSGV